MMGVLDRFLRSVDSWLLNLDARFDENGNPSDICDVARGGAYNLHLQYDARDRLIAAGSGVFGGDGWHRYTYDALDNIKSWRLGSGGKDYANYYYDPGTNRLQGIRDSAGATVVGLAYDAQGNLQNKSGQLYGFGFDNRLYIAAGKEQDRYDGEGQRVLAWSPVDGTSALSQYSKSGQLMYYSKSSGAGLEHIYVSGSLIAKRETVGNVVKFQHTDALGSPVAVTDGSGAVIERNDYAPYGAVIGKPAYDAVGYTGHKQDGATGLTYMQQRYYDPQIGRFLSVDPVTAYSNPIGAFNRYWYANNNPYRFTDPDGRQACGKDRTCRLEQGEPGWTVGPIPQASGSSSGTRPSASSSGGRWNDLRDKLGLKGDLTKNGNILDVGALVHDVYYPLVDSPGGAGFKLAGLGVLAVTLRAEGKLAFRTGHYASRLEAVGLNVSRTEAVIAREVARIRPNMATGVDVVGRISVNGVLVEYRVRALANGTINVGTIFPVR